MTDESTVIAEYRALLTKTEQEAQATFDKTVLTLSGGALGLSFAFTKDVVGAHNVVHTSFLLSAWIGWGLSATSVLSSFFTSQMALRKAISQLDQGQLGSDAEKMERPGGWYDRLTATLNASGLVLFLVGLVAMMIFLICNLKDHMNEPRRTANDGQLVPPVPVDVQVAVNAGQLAQAPPPSLVKATEAQPLPAHVQAPPIPTLSPNPPQAAVQNGTHKH